MSWPTVTDGHWYLTGLDLDDVLEGFDVWPELWRAAGGHSVQIVLPALTATQRARAVREIMGQA